MLHDNPESAIVSRKSGDWSLRARLTALLLATLIPLAGLAVYWTAWEVRHDRDRVERQAQEAAVRVAVQVADIVGDVQGMLAVLARVPAVRAGDRAEAERLFREVLATSPYLENIAAFARDGTLFATTTPLASRARILVQDRAWFQAVVHTGRPIASGFLVSRISGKPVAVLGQPLLDELGRVQGVVGAGLHLAAFSQEVAPIQIGASVLLAVVDGEDLVLFHGDPGAAIGQSLGPLPGMLRAEAVVRSTEWRAIVGIPESVVAAGVRQELWEIGLPALLVLLLATGVGFRIAYGTWRPLQDLAGAVRRIGAGEAGVRIPVEAGGEVGEVATSFAETLAALAAREADLRRRHGELTALVKANQAIASSLDLEHSLQSIVREAAAISGTSVVRLFLLDEDAHVLRCRVGVGLPPGMEQDLVMPLGESFSGKVAATGEPQAVADTRGDARLRFPPHVTQYGLISYLGLPVKWGERLFGVLVLNTHAPRVYAEDEIALLSTFARQAAIAIQNAGLFAATERAAREARGLYEVAHSLTTLLSSTEVLHLISVKTTELLGTPHAQVVVWDEATQTLQFGAAYGTQAEGVRHQQFRLGEGANGIVAQTRAPLIVNDYQAFPHRVPGFTEPVAVIGVPLLYRDRFLGVLTSHATQPGSAFTQEHLALLTSFADQAAVALENARLHDAIRHHATDLEDRVRERTAELEEALRVKAQFLANMSHELRTPLNFILGFTQLLQQGTAGPLTSKQAHYLGHIHAGGKRLFDLVTDMLDLSQGKTGKKDLHLEPVLLGPMVEELLGMVRVQAAQKGLRVSTALDPRLLFVVADRGKLTQILANLIGNAVKFTPEGGHITLRAYQKAESTKQTAGDEQQAADASVLPSAGCLLPSVVIEVEDTGIGIKPEDLERIFQYFEQVDSSDTRKYGGAGLGLALVRTLVELHGGRVWAESEGEGHGARFVVRLPHLEALRRKRVMLVADEAPILGSLGTVLGGAGYAVEPARSGAQALAALDANPPDLLVLDIGLPGGDGWEILRQVRESEATRALPVLVLTGPDQIHADRALALGANEFLAKPVSARILVETVNGLLVWRELAGGEEGEPSAISPDE